MLSLTNGQGRVLTLTVLTGACWSRTWLNRALNAFNLSSASSKMSMTDQGAFEISSRNASKVSWRHPRSKHWHQLDMILTRRDSINSVCSTRAFHSADCDTDHSLIAAKVKLKPRKIHHSKKKGQPRCCD